MQGDTYSCMLEAQGTYVKGCPVFLKTEGRGRAESVLLDTFFDILTV